MFYKALLLKSSRIIPLEGYSIFSLKKKEDLEERRKKLEEFTKYVAGEMEFLNCEETRKFFEIDLHLPSFAYEPPHQIKVPLTSIKNDIFFYSYAKAQNLMITVENDKDTTSKATGFFSDLFSSSKKQYSFVKFWDEKFINNENTSFKKIAEVTYNHKVSTISFLVSENLITLGHYNGEILVYEYRGEGKVDLRLVIKAHPSKVFCAAKIPKIGFIISSAKDCKTNIYSFSEGTLINSYNEDRANKLMHLDEKEKKIFFGNASGLIFIYDISTFPCAKLGTITTSSILPIKSMVVDTSNNIIFAGNNEGNICQIELNPKAKHQGKVVNELNLKEPLCTMAWRPERSELIIGSKTGIMRFISIMPFYPYLGLQICKRQIRSIIIDEQTKSLLVCSLDNPIILLQLPENYIHYKYVKPYAPISNNENEIEISQKKNAINSKVEVNEPNPDDLSDWTK